MLQKIQTITLSIWDLLIGIYSSLLYSALGIQIRTTKCVGIFSREGESCYRFLQDFLTSSRRVVREVRPFAITNNGQRQFIEEVPRCDVAILYHSKKRGRVNITDVTDCLYSQELDHLHRTLGKRSVIVVADDLDRSSAEEKRRILREQPQIQQMAHDLFLLSEENRRNDDSHMKEALNDILSIINRAFYIHIEPHKDKEVPVLTPLTVRVLQFGVPVIEYTDKFLKMGYSRLRTYMAKRRQILS